MGRTFASLAPGLALAVLVVILVGGSGSRGRATAAVGDVRSPVALVAEASRPRGLTVAAGHVDGSTHARLAAEAMAPLAGWLSPVAVPSPDGRAIAYSTWRELRRDDPRLSWSEQGIAPGDALARPSLRLHDLGSAEDDVVEDGALSAAWRRDGALAYVRGVDPDYRAWRPYVGDVVVRAAGAAKGSVWSEEPARYVVAAWAGDVLLAYRIGEGERLDVVAFDGPRRSRLLAADAALVAVSPDGRRAFVADASRPPAVVRVVSAANGSEQARLALAGRDAPRLQWVGYAGSWADDLVVAESDRGLAVFRVGGDAIELVQLLELDSDTFPHGAVEPQFSVGTEHVLARAETPVRGGAADDVRTVLLDCDRERATCTRYASAPPRDWLRHVYNPSRPLGARR